MTDIQEPDIDLEATHDFIEEKWKNAKCERCEANDWTVDTASFSYVNVSSDPNEANDLSNRKLQFLPVACKNCGNLVLIWKGAFDRWRAGRTTTEE